MSSPCIYTISCLKSKDIFYVGKSTRILEERLKQHIACSGTVKNYIQKMGITPVIEVIDEIPISDIESIDIWERFWIDQIRQWGFTLINKRRIIGRIAPPSIKKPEAAISCPLQTNRFNGDLLSREILKMKGDMSLRDLAKQSEISIATLSRLSRGNEPDVNTLFIVSKWLKKPMDMFFS